MKDERLRTEDPRKLLTELAIPAICAQIVTLLYNTVDRFYIGRMENGAIAMAGIGLCVPITTVLTGLSSLFGRGGAPLAAISLGKGDREEAEDYLGNSFMGLILFSLAVMAVGLIFLEPMLALFGASENTLPYAADYLRIYLWGAMVTTMLGALLNVVLDPIFMFNFHMGIAGAALATVLAQMVSCIFVLCFLLGKRTQIRLRLKKMRLRMRPFKKVMFLGASPFFMTSSEGIMQICFNVQMLKYGGDLAVSAMTILFSMFQFVNLPLTGVAQGSQPIISFNYGAKEYGRMRETLKLAMWVCLAFSLCSTTLMMLFPGFFIRLFNSEPELVTLGSRMLRVYIAGCFFIGANTLYQQTYTSMGEGKMSFFFAFFRKVILLIPLLYLLPAIFPWGVFAVALAEPVSDLTTTICNKLCFSRFMKNKLS